MSIAARAGARMPHGDSFFSDVLLLANGAGLLIDSSKYNRVLTSENSIARNGTFPLNGANTYSTPPSGRLNNNDGAAVASLVGSSEWCAEGYIRYGSASFGIEGNVNQWPFGITSITPSRQIRYINSSLLLDLLTPTGLPSGAFGHYAIICDNTTDPTWRRYHIAIEGVVRATSTENIPKASVETVSGVRVMGFDVNSPTVTFGGYRFTRNTRRYLNNAQGEAVNDFSPDAYPFLAF